MKLTLKGLNDNETVEVEFLSNGVMTFTVNGFEYKNGGSQTKAEVSVGQKEAQLFREFLGETRKERY